MKFGCCSVRPEVKDEADTITPKHSYQIVRNIKDVNIKWRKSKDNLAVNRMRFDENCHLVELNLESCGINIIPPQIGKLNFLETIVLCNNDIDYLPECTQHMTTLKSVSLQNNQLTSIPRLPPTVEKLYLEGNPIKDLSALPSYTNLHRLSLQECGLKSLPDDIGTLENLTVLELHGNHLTCLPSSFGNMTKLNRLSLHSNELTELPDTFCNLAQLTWLSLHYNQLSCLPNNIGNLKKLQRVSLHQNGLKSLPDSFAECSEMIVLSLFKNKLVEVPKQLYRNFTKCEKLSLHQNHFTYIPSDIQYMTSLEELWIHDNNITALPAELNLLPNLHTIWVTDESENNQVIYDELRTMLNIKITLK